MAAQRFELRTLRVWTACSSQLSYAAMLLCFIVELMTGIEPVTLSLPRIRSADWATSAEIGFWLRGEDLNLWPSGYEPDELPTAPPRDIGKDFLELARGIEPPTCWLQVSCSANWATPAWCLRAESNHWHGDFQSPALPTELPRHHGDPKGTWTPDLRRDRAAF